jgi:hypothetical protein
MSSKGFRSTAFGLLALLALVVATSAPAGRAPTVTISHVMRGCHSWALGSGPIRATLSVTVRTGTVLHFVNNDVMQHKLIQTAGPKLRLTHPNMNRMAASASVSFLQKGVYRFTTKAGEDYKWAASMKTIGEDHVLRLTVHVK